MPAQPRNEPLAGILWMILSGLLFVGVAALVRYLGTSMPATQTAFLRYVFGTLMLMPFALKIIRHANGNIPIKIFIYRGIAHSVAVILWFYSMARIPIADVTALGYMTPIYISIGAVLFLGETMAFRRVLAIIVAIMGVLVILRPGIQEISIGHLSMLVTSLFMGTSYLIAKHLSKDTDPLLVVFALSVTVLIGLAPGAIYLWQPPSSHELFILAIIAGLATLGHFTMTKAFAAAPVTVTQPVSFMQLVWAVLIGFLLFNEPFDIWVIAGGAMIIASVSFITWREAVLRKRIKSTQEFVPKP